MPPISSALARKKRNQECIAGLMSSLAPKEGVQPSILPGVRFAREIRNQKRCPAVYEPGIVIVGQGRKRGHVGNEVYTYDANHYLVLSVSLPAVCEIIASPENPMVCMVINVDIATLGELLLEMDDHVPAPSNQVPRGIAASVLTPEMQDATIRLLECLKKPADAKVLGRQIVREIIYRALRGEQGHALRAVATRQSYSGQISKVLQRIHLSYAEKMDIPKLAREASMSVSVFHHNFKAITCSSPIQYIKNMRLHKARMLIAHEGLNASIAAERVGYESASQFSREFKRLFGYTPSKSPALLGS